MSADRPAPNVSRSAISRILRETADLLELKGENPFRARAYANAGRAVEGMVDDPQERLEAGTLAEVPGIGPGLVAGIAEIVQTGALALHEELKARFAPGVLDLLRVPGLGSKRLRTLIDVLAIDSPAALEKACAEGRVASLAGFGAKSQEKLVAGIASMKKFAERRLIPEALEAAERIRFRLAGVPGVLRVEIAGSVRRRLETIGNVDLVAAVAPGPGETEEPAHARVLDAFLADPAALESLACGAATAAMRISGGLRADLRLVGEQELAPAWLYFTGSREHNAALRERSAARGWTLDARGLFAGEERLEAATEADIYRHLGLAFIPPEAREGLDEIALAERAFAAGESELATAVTVEDLRGTFHVHTTWSDGIATVAQMAEAAGALGWDYLGIADHSKVAAYAGGLDAGRVRAQWAEIDAWNESGRQPWLFKGTECDILADGALDFDDELLAGFDYVVVSVHSRFSLSRDAMTSRMVRAVSHPRVTFLGHATGRLLLVRDPYEVDIESVLDAAAANGVIVEVNANAHRLDLDWRQLRGWLGRGMPTSIHPDAHTPQGLQDVRWGVGVARKAMARPDQVLNCRSLPEIRDYFDERRRRAGGLLRQA
jgi:DNA polymerase (family 10)